MSRKAQNILSICVGVLGVLMAIGVRTFLRPCVHEDGSLAACSGAGDLIFWLGIILALAGVARGWVKGKAGIAVAAVLLVLSILLILAPGTLRPICAMASMRCRLVTRPAAMVTGILAAVLSLISLIGALREKKG